MNRLRADYKNLEKEFDCAKVLQEKSNKKITQLKAELERERLRDRQLQVFWGGSFDYFESIRIGFSFSFLFFKKFISELQL